MRDDIQSVLHRLSIERVFYRRMLRGRRVLISCAYDSVARTRGQFSIHGTVGDLSI